MRLRKHMKRTAAAALALSMAISTATPAMAGYKIDMSQVKGDVTITKDADDNVIVSVDGGDQTGIEETKGDEITITGDNRGSAVENSTEENSTTVTQEAPEEPAEDTTGGVATMDLTEEDYAPAAEDEDTTEDAPKAEEPARTVEETEDGTVITYDDYDVAPDVQVTKPAARAEKSTPRADKDDDGDAVTYEGKTTNSVTKAFADTVRNVIKIINNSANELKVTLKDLTVDAGSTAKDAMNISGTGDVTLELEGDNTLVGGSGLNDKNNVGDGIGYSSNLKIAGKNGNKGNLKAVGGSVDSVEGKRNYSYYAGSGLSSHGGDLSIKDADVTLRGGDINGKNTDGWSVSFHAGSGFYGAGLRMSNVDLKAYGGTARASNTSSRDVYAYGGEGVDITWTFEADKSSISAIGGAANADGDNIYAGGGEGLGTYATDTVIKDTTIYAEGGKATGNDTRGGYGWYFSYECGGDAENAEVTNSEITAVGGDAEGSGTSGNGISTETMEDMKAVFKKSTVKASAGNASGDAKSAAAISYAGTLEFTDGSNATFEYKDNYEDQGDNVILSPDESSTVKIVLPNGADASGEYGVSQDEESAGTTYIYTKNETGTGADLAAAKQGDKTYDLTDDSVEKQLPTCTEAGWVKADGETVTLPAAGHDWVDGVCSICGAVKPEEPDEPVTPVDPVDPGDNGGSSSNSSASFTVSGAEAYETTFADGRYTIAVPAEDAVLTATLGYLRELKAQGAEALVFRTQHCESVLNIDTMLAQGPDETVFVLTHSGSAATLTVGGVQHNELIG